MAKDVSVNGSLHTRNPKLADARMQPSLNPRPAFNNVTNTRRTSPPTRPMKQDSRRNPGFSQVLTRTNGPVVQPRPQWADHAELKVIMRNFPPGFQTLGIYRLLKTRGNIIRIEILEPDHPDRTDVAITFSPPPRDANWVKDGLKITLNKKERYVSVNPQPPRPLYRHKSPLDRRRTFAEEIKVRAACVGFGVMKAEDKMLNLYTSHASEAAPIELLFNLKRTALDITFPIPVKYQSGPLQNETKLYQQPFKLRLNLAQVADAFRLPERTRGQLEFIIQSKLPPVLFKKTGRVERTHEFGATLWTDWQIWFRQTGIGSDEEHAHLAATQLQNEDATIDVGRWLTYRLVFDLATVRSNNFYEFCEALRHHDVSITTQKGVGLDFEQGQGLWNWLHIPTQVSDPNATPSTLADLAEMAQDANLPFEVRYQLEVCLSNGNFNECNINTEFLRIIIKHVEKDHMRTVQLLEKVADDNKRWYKPAAIFDSDLWTRVSLVQKPLPSYCAFIRSATITPTTIYFHTRAMETSNRVIRRFSQYQDQFLRVRFLDETYKGKIMSSPEASMDEVFDRIKRTMMNGIKVGDRHYEFLAFGNSQFRENGAYFFASSNSVTAQDIRTWMGSFSHINVVAKYCSRIGQCFSTSRAINLSVKIERTPDIERNGYCFTDGVGKISPFLAQMIAQEFGLPTTTGNYPSVFQFRLAGCKGVLAVDPTLTHSTVEIRPSQEKFQAMQHRGLEIIRISQFSSAYLNVQLILVLSALGVTDKIFVEKMKQMLSDLSEAMVKETKATELLEKNVDYNFMTYQIRDMVADGFMESKDPFTISCLQLWRAWSIKYLKEKARILIDKGAFVLGCVDETATLRGYFDKKFRTSDELGDITALPEIFLQVPDTDNKGRWKVITGVCALARNPSLHPGDVRIVNAVDKRELHHLRNCVVLPQTGDRDLASMCSGGDLDGDDYLVIWDQELIPSEWNHSPMDYTAPPPVVSAGPVTVDDMTSFFVTYMKHDILRPVAVAHKYWADQKELGVKDPVCIELAQLHSTAVDFPKTGVPAEMAKRLRNSRWPHWSEVKNKAASKIYDSKKVIGQLYDEVKRVPFEPDYRLPFDRRVLDAYDLDSQTLEAAAKAKQHYDEAVSRLMAKFSIKTEFEIWTTFALSHSDDIGDYKFAEIIGEAVNALKDSHKKLCYEMMGTTDKERDWSKIAPFVAAMYAVTANQVTARLAQRDETKMVAGLKIKTATPSKDNMPFISFPWLFPTELGRIANKRGHASSLMLSSKSAATVITQRQKAKNPHLNITDEELPPLPDVVIPEGIVHGGEMLDLYSHDKKAEAQNKEGASQPAIDLQHEKSASTDTSSAERSLEKHVETAEGSPSNTGLLLDGLQEIIKPAISALPTEKSAAGGHSDTQVDDEESEQNDVDSDDDEGREVVTLHPGESSLDKLQQIME